MPRIRVYSFFIKHNFYASGSYHASQLIVKHSLPWAIRRNIIQTLKTLTINIWQSFLNMRCGTFQLMTDLTVCNAISTFLWDVSSHPAGSSIWRCINGCGRWFGSFCATRETLPKLPPRWAICSSHSSPRLITRTYSPEQPYTASSFYVTPSLVRGMKPNDISKSQEWRSKEDIVAHGHGIGKHQPTKPRRTKRDFFFTRILSNKSQITFVNVMQSSQNCRKPTTPKSTPLSRSTGRTLRVKKLENILNVGNNT